LCNADANRAGRELAVDVPFGCEAELRPDAEEEPREPPPDALDPAIPDELPPADKPLPDAFRLECPPPRQDEDDDEDEEEDGENDEPPENPRSETGAAGLARESTNTSPRMCSTNCAGTPGGLTGWVKTMCTPVAVTVSSPALFVPGPGPNWKVPPDDGDVEPVVEVVADCSFEPVVVLGAVPAFVHELGPVVPDGPHAPDELVVLDCVLDVVVVVGVVLGPRLGGPLEVVVVFVLPVPVVLVWSHEAPMSLGPHEPPGVVVVLDCVLVGAGADGGAGRPPLPPLPPEPDWSHEPALIPV
jgi:hypothetical protein